MIQNLTFNLIGGKDVSLDFIDKIMIGADMKTFKAVEILNPLPTAGFNLHLKKHYKYKDTIVDVPKWRNHETLQIVSLIEAI